MPAGGGLCRRAVDCAGVRWTVPAREEVCRAWHSLRRNRIRARGFAPVDQHGYCPHAAHRRWSLGIVAASVLLVRRKRPKSRRRLSEASRNETLRLIKVSISRRFAPQEDDGRRRCASPTSKICKAPARTPDTICKIRPRCSQLLLRRQACRFHAGSVQI